MRLAGFLVIPLATAGITATGLYAAAPALAACEARNGTMLCTDPPPPGAPPAAAPTTSYPCVVDLYCNNFEFDVVIGSGSDNDNSGGGGGGGRFPRPTPHD